MEARVWGHGSTTEARAPLNSPLPCALGPWLPALALAVRAWTASSQGWPPLTLSGYEEAWPG